MNRYTKLIKSLKEDAPTNSMSGVYSLNAPGHRVGRKDPSKRFYPDIDGNFTDGIPGNSGDPYYERPQGYWDGGSEWSEDLVPDASQDYLDNDPTGKSTNDLIAEDGTVKTFLPPNSRHFILGPLVDGYVLNHGYDNYTNIGYIQKDTRQFVLLARIQGQFIEGLHPQGGRVWNGTADQLTIYNSNFTLEMAEWFRDQITAGKSTSNVPYFYSGGVPQVPQSAASCPNCPPNMFGGVTPGTAPGGGFGTGTLPSLGTQQADSQSGNQNQANIFNLTPDQLQTLMNALMLGLDIVAVVAMLFPEPASSAAGAAHLASKLRYVSKITQALKRLNPFVRGTSTKSKIRYKYRPSKAKYGDGAKPKDPMDRVLKDIDDASKRLQQQPRDTNYTGPSGSEVRGPYSDVKAQSRPGSGKYKSSSRNYDSKNNPSFGSRRGTRKFTEDCEYILEQINNYMLFEVAPTGSGSAGGTEVADAYVDQVSQDSSPEELEQASNDANDIATQGGQGLSDSDLSNIDKQAEKEAKRITNINVGDPLSMTDDQLMDAIVLMFEADEDIATDLTYQYEYLIDKESVEEAYNEYEARREYLSSEEFEASVSPQYITARDTADRLWDSSISRGLSSREATFTKDNVPYWWTGRTPEEGETFNVYALVWDDTNQELSKSDYDTVREWSSAWKIRDYEYQNVIWPEKKKQLDLAKEEYYTASNLAYREFLIAIINGWNEGNVNDDDPYSLEDLTAKDISDMTEAEKEELKQLLLTLGISYGDIASAAAGDVISTGIIELVAGAGIAIFGALGTLYNLTNDQVQNMYQSVGASNPAAVPSGETPQQAQEREAAEKKLADAESQYGPDSDEAAEARRERSELLTNHKKQRRGETGSTTGDAKKQKEAEQEAAKKARDERLKKNNELSNKQQADKIKGHKKQEKKGKQRTDEDDIQDLLRGETYNPPKFIKNREREQLSETRTPKQRRLIREIKQPVKVKEAPTKYKMNFAGKYSPQNTPSATASPESDALVASGNEKGRKWRESDKYWSGYETTERMNVIHDRVGHGSQYWDRMLDEAKAKNGWRTKEMQEELNKIAHEKAMLKENPDYRSPFGDGVEIEDTTSKNVQNFERVTKIKKVVADTKSFNNKEIKPEYPDDKEKRQKDMLAKMSKYMTPEMEKMKKEYEGSKAQTGENASARYKRLDPVSARSMPDAGYPQIDAFRDQAKKKSK